MRSKLGANLSRSPDVARMQSSSVHLCSQFLSVILAGPESKQVYKDGRDDFRSRRDDAMRCATIK